MANESGVLENAASAAVDEGKKLGCSDVAVTAYDSDSSQVRFSNNNITLVNKVRDIFLSVYLAKDRKRIIGDTSNPNPEGVRKFIQNLVASCEALPQSSDYSPLPSGPFNYERRFNFDPKVRDADLVDFVKQSIDAALSSGAKRVSGVLNTNCSRAYILTTQGANGFNDSSEMLLNVRAFAEDDASGHGLSCTSYLSDFDPEKAGRTAGSYAKRALHPASIPEGRYNVVFTPTVVANILPLADAASAFRIESGLSYLPSETEKRIAVETFRIDDYGVYEHGLGGRTFDDEGFPTGHTLIVESGVFRNMLHNSTTAKKFGTKTTGNAGIIFPGPNTTVFGEGRTSFDEIINETREGLLVTNNWYTRYQNMRTGEYSTVPRDAAFLIKGGEIAGPIAGIRISDSVPRQISNIAFISKERQWIKWWEVHTPTLAPAMMITDVQVTRAVGS